MIIANRFNKFFIEIDSKPASSIPNSSKGFTRFISVSVTLLVENIFQDIPLEEAYNNLKST